MYNHSNNTVSHSRYLYRGLYSLASFFFLIRSCVNRKGEKTRVTRGIPTTIKVIRDKFASVIIELNNLKHINYIFCL